MTFETMDCSYLICVELPCGFRIFSGEPATEVFV